LVTVHKRIQKVSRQI
jgi:hypothetical protein